MSTEELLKPRYKVIAPYPNSPYKVGEILTEFFFDNGNSYFSVNDENGFHDKVISSETIKECPNIFKEVEWWEDRKIEDMPEYVRFSHLPIVWKIKKWDFDWFKNPIPEKNVQNGETLTILYHFDKSKMLPSTQEEYKQYQQSKK